MIRIVVNRGTLEKNLQVKGDVTMKNYDNLFLPVKDLKKAFLKVLLGTLLILPTVVYPQYDGKTLNSNLNTTGEPKHITLTWTDDPKTTATITWRANNTSGKGKIMYRIFGTGTGKELVSEAVEENIVSKQDGIDFSCKLYSADVKDLVPGTKYQYKAYCGDKASLEYSFTTAPEDLSPFKFLIFGDSQSINTSNPDYTEWHETVSSAFKANPDSAFFVNVGDLVDSGGSYIHWENWFSAAACVLPYIFMAPVQGNHETFSERGVGFPEMFVKQFKLYKNGPEGYKGRVYSFDYSNVHFVVLDSQYDEESKIDPEILTKQAVWLDKDLYSSATKWKFVLFHKPPYVPKNFRTNKLVKQVFCPVIEKYNVNVVFNGHDHIVKRTFPIKDGKAVSTQQYGTVYYTTGRSGPKYYKNLEASDLDAFFTDVSDSPVYIVCNVNGEKAVIIAVKKDGTVIDKCELNK